MPLRYRVPPEYYFRIHHIRPRFKFDVENVLIHMATEISKIPCLPQKEFARKVNEGVRRFPGNQTKSAKTIANWRTEISSLFGLIELLPLTGKYSASRMAIRLANNQDLVEFFKIFLYFFQYPGAHLKSYEAHDFIKVGIRFRPVPYVLRILRYGEKSIKRNFGITKAELTHCVFNDLRVTRDSRSVRKVYNLIVSNRRHKIDYDWEPQVTRYAKDILDYMVYADLLKYRSVNKRYYLNPSASGPIQAFINSNVYFKGYDPLYKKKRLTNSAVSDVSHEWFAYVNQDVDEELFRTSIIEYLDGMINDEQSLLPETIKRFLETLRSGSIDTKIIGDFGEALVHGHECARLSNEGRNDIINKIKQIPSHFGVGYDILSLEADERKRHVEVKTTISRDQITFKQFHLTTNEWVVAEGLDGSYFVYRVSINKTGVRLFVIQDPVNKYKNGMLQMIPRDGADIKFTDASGEQQELLIWEN